MTKNALFAALLSALPAAILAQALSGTPIGAPVVGGGGGGGGGGGSITEAIDVTSFGATATEGNTLTCTHWPCPIFVSAKDTVASGVTDPLHEVWYEWTYGDTDAATLQIAGRDTSLNEGLSPIHGHVYDSASFPSTCGSNDCAVHTVTLTATAEIGGVQVTETATVTVNEISPDDLFQTTDTTCYCNEATCTDDVGCPAGATNGGDVSTTLSTAIAACVTAAPQRCLFEGGVTFTGGGSQTFGTGSVLIGSYGTGQATFEHNFTSTTPYKMNASCGGLVINNVAMNFPGTETAAVFDNSSTSLTSQCLLVNKLTVGTGANRPHILTNFWTDAASQPAIHDQLYFNEISVEDSGHGTSNPMMGLAVEKGFVIGSVLSSQSGNEHVIRSPTYVDLVIDATVLKEQQNTKNLLSARNHADDGYVPSDRLAVTRSEFAAGNSSETCAPCVGGAPLALCASNGATGDLIQFEDMWILRNAFWNADPGASRWSLGRYSSTQGGFGTGGYCREITFAQNYGQLTDQNSADGHQRVFDASGATGVRVRSNVAVMTNSGHSDDSDILDGGTATVVENNVIYSLGTGVNDIATGVSESADNLKVTSDPFNVVSGNPATTPDWDDLDITTGSALLDAGTLDHINTDAKGQARGASPDTGVFEKQ